MDRAPPDPEEARGWLRELCERSSTVGFPALAPVTLEEGRPAPAVLELDAGLVPDPERIIAAFEREVGALLRLKR
ncbi:MAG: hypothetical protein K0R88_2035 [Solirubrobacterales bacterium]|nr:hypothetical protein [Solirubrobacterales bacterium]